MKKQKIRSFNSLINEMKAVARGKKKSPKDAGGASYESDLAIRHLVAEQHIIEQMVVPTLPVDENAILEEAVRLSKLR